MNVIADDEKDQIPRRYDLDWLRVLVFALLILYHVGMMYVSWIWHIKSEHRSLVLESVMTFVNQWRLPLLFLISGIATSIILRKMRTGLFAWSRLKRLLLPLIFAVIFLIPPQSYYELLFKGELEPGYLVFWSRYLSFDQSFSIVIPTWNHLWYLMYLLVFSFVLIVLLKPLRSQALNNALSVFFRSHPRLKLLLVPPLLLAVYGWFLRPYFPQTLDLVNDWYNLAFYFTVFLFGFLISDKHEVWQVIDSARGLALLMGVVMAAVLLTLYNLYFSQLDSLGLRLIYAAAAFNLWAWMLAILGYGHRFLNRKSKTLSYATEAVYPYYILHQTIIVVFGYWAIQWGLGGGMESLLIILVTFGGCAVLHEFFIRRIKVIRPLFGLKNS